MDGMLDGILTDVLIMYSCGTAQATYPAIGPAAFAIGAVCTMKYVARRKYRRRHGLGDGWIPFATCTLCLAPVVGGVVAGKCLYDD